MNRLILILLFLFMGISPNYSQISYYITPFFEMDGTGVDLTMEIKAQTPLSDIVYLQGGVLGWRAGIRPFLGLQFQGDLYKEKYDYFLFGNTGFTNFKTFELDMSLGIDYNYSGKKSSIMLGYNYRFIQSRGNVFIGLKFFIYE